MNPNLNEQEFEEVEVVQLPETRGVAYSSTSPLGGGREDILDPEEHMRQLRESIQQEGIRQPITVWADEMEIEEGYHRVQAARELGLKTVPVRWKR